MIFLYYIFLVFAGFVSILPFRILYAVSDFLYLILYYLIGYRKKVVYKNLKNAFPEKTERELKKIAKKYYHNLCDVFVEVLKFPSTSKKQLRKRISFKNIETIHKFYKSGRNIIAVTGHMGNWEWIVTGGLSLQTDYKVVAAFKPLSNKKFEKYMTEKRTRFIELVRQNSVLRAFARNKDKPLLLYLAADQSPTKNEIEYRTSFLNQDTPVFLGTEKIAKMVDCVVVFINTQRIKRGFYEAEVVLISDRPKDTADFEITEKHVKLLEKAIIEHPDNWLWSHKRWKHKINEQ